MPITFLDGQFVTLRPLQESDLGERYAQWLNDAQVCEFNSHAVLPYSFEQMRRYYESIVSGSDRQVVLAIVEKSSARHVGNVSLQSIDWIGRSAEFAILFGEVDCWGKGYGTEAALLICRYGFDRLNLNRIHCGTIAGNEGMIRLAARLDMTHEGTRRQAVYKNGRYLDLLEFGVLRNEFEA